MVLVNKDGVCVRERETEREERENLQLRKNSELVRVAQNFLSYKMRERESQRAFLLFSIGLPDLKIFQKNSQLL